jgi:hypothetical protein
VTRHKATKASTGAPTKGLPAAAADEPIRREWLRRVEAEYRSAAVTSSLSHWLIQLAAPVGLIELALRIIADELSHAELSHQVYRDAGGVEPPRLPREGLGLPRSTDALEHDVLRHGVEVFCLGETVAVRLFSRMRARCDVPSARAALDRILRDEVRHRDFGWTLLEWLLASPQTDSRRRLVQAELGGMLERQRARYASGVGATDCPLEHRRWGLIARSEYADALAETLARDYRPLFADLAIDLPP